MRSAILIVPAMALAACGQHSSTTTTTADGNTTTTTETTAATPTTATTTTTATVPSAASLGLQPGKWETTIAIQEMTVNGVNRTPPNGAAAQKATSCLTPEQAAKGPGEFLKAAGAHCTATSSNFGGGRMDIEMVCKMPMGTLTTKSTGTYTPTSMTSDAVGSVSGRMSISEKLRTEAHRIGECN
jgi:hypothetical protein